MRPSEQDSEVVFSQVITRLRRPDGKPCYLGEVYDDSDRCVGTCSSDDRDEVTALCWGLYDSAVAAHHEESCRAWWNDLSPEERRELADDGDTMAKAKDDRIRMELSDG